MKVIDSQIVCSKMIALKWYHLLQVHNLPEGASNYTLLIFNEKNRPINIFFLNLSDTNQYANISSKEQRVRTSSVARTCVQTHYVLCIQ